MARGPQGERGPEGREGPEGPRGSIDLKTALAFILAGFGVAAAVIVSGIFGSPGEFGTPPAPQPIQESGAYAHYDVQIHSRDNFLQWDAPMNAEHTSTCEPPPGTHSVQLLSQSVYICADHFMTAGNAAGYGEIVVTPSQTVNCSGGCTVQWDMSTQRQSSRDWPDVWLTPYADNLTLPFDVGDVDNQGVPRQGIHVNAEASQNSWAVSTISNYVETFTGNQWWIGMGDGIDPSVNQAAVRQTFKLTVTPGHVKMERLASATAAQFTWVDADAPVLLASDYVVQFAQHIYNPTKDDAGVPATWHWSNLTLSNATPFTLIHTSPVLVTANDSVVVFAAPAPANAYLRFSGVCQVLTDAANPGVMTVAPKQAFIGHFEHASPYFIPIGQGRTSVKVSFAPDDWYNQGFSPGCGAQDFHVWSKEGGPPLTPTPSPTSIPPTATSTSVPSATPTPTAISPTATLVAPTATRTPTATLPTPTPILPKAVCTIRWGSSTVVNLGQMTQAECAARGQ